ncbi:MAG: LLM class flavin-dependent oxidoreductase [Myxococcales bacterium]|nr:LLM class flavin-dependent oxidoreductase [Myxococcales bacterium]
MKFALFYEIPVPRPWTPGKEQAALKNTIEQAVFGEEMGFHSFWTVEHHFLDEFSHCSNPEILYGAIAARTTTLRIGYGVRLTPKPYNHPIRTAESIATLDNISDGRVEWGTGRSATRLELEGFGINPHETREMLGEAIDFVVGCWTNDEYEFEGKYWQMPKRRVHPKPVQDPHPPIWTATTSVDGHYEVGKMGVGLLSFAVGVPPEDLIPRVEAYKKGQADCEKPKGLFRNDQVVAFTMAHCTATNEQAFAEGEESMVWYPKKGPELIGATADYARQFQKDLGTYHYTADMKQLQQSGAVDALTFDYIRDVGAAMVGDPDRCTEIAKRYEAAGCDLLFCLLNPYNISHEQVMNSIEHIGKYVIPEFDN